MTPKPTDQTLFGTQIKKLCERYI